MKLTATESGMSLWRQSLIDNYGLSETDAETFKSGMWIDIDEPEAEKLIKDGHATIILDNEV